MPGDQQSLSSPPRRPDHSRNATHGRKKADHLLSGRRPSPLARLVRRSETGAAWTAQLRALLPQEVAAECQVANVRDQVLSVHINNAAWATRFRLLVPDLLPRLRQLADFAAVTDVRVKVQPDAQTSVRSQQHRDKFPASTANPPDGETLTDFAATLEYDQLRDAILRLASHANMPTETQEEGAARADSERPEDS